MAVEITQITDDEITGNQKSVYKDSNGKWIASQELSINEIRAFQEHIKSIDSNANN